MPPELNINNNEGSPQGRVTFELLHELTMPLSGRERLEYFAELPFELQEAMWCNLWLDCLEEER